MAGGDLAQQQLLEWYRSFKRDFPWRANRDPYRIWISETMLQQTTTTAVIPFFERFVKAFPDLETLATAKVEEVVGAWAGLGYYSRARNLHKSAQALHALGGFPRTFAQLIELPGFGPYTARAVASLAFSEPVGVVDGNVIRVLSRLEAQAWEWWRTPVRNEIQILADRWVQGVPSEEMNQAFMELGRTVCTPRSPSCLLCPIRAGCGAFRAQKIQTLPLPRPRRAREMWWWQPEIQTSKGRVGLVRNSTLPFLKGQWLLPGKARKVTQPPQKVDYRHSITHHDIFVTVTGNKSTLKKNETLWVPLADIDQHVPTSLVRKALAHVLADRARGVREQKQSGAGRTGGRLGRNRPRR